MFKKPAILKIIALIILAVCIVTLLSAVVFAATDVKILDDEANKNYTAGKTESAAASLIIGIPKWLMGVLKISDLVTLVFMKPVDIDYGDGSFITVNDNSQYEDKAIFDSALSAYNNSGKAVNVKFSYTYGTINKSGYVRSVDETTTTFHGVTVTTYTIHVQIMSTVETQNPLGLTLNVFPHGVFDLVLKIKTAFEKFVGIALFLTIAITAMFMLFRSTASSVQYGKLLLLNICLSACVLKFATFFFNLLIQWNVIGVNYFYSILGAQNNLSFIELLWSPYSNTNSLGMAIVAFLSIFLIASMNFQYNVRMLMLGVLYFSSPAVAVVSIYPSKKDVLNLWANELVGNVFTQLGHAVTLTFFIGVIHAVSGTTYAFWITMAALLSLNSITMLVRSLLGLTSFNNKALGGLGFAGNALGLGAILGMSRMFGSMAGRRGGAQAGNMSESKEEMLNSVAQSTTGSGNSGSPTGNFLKQGLAGGFKTAARLGLGVTGAMAGGMISSAAGQDPMTGISIGALGGFKAGGSLSDKTIGGVSNVNQAVSTYLKNKPNIKDFVKDKAGFHDSYQYSDMNEFAEMGRKVGYAFMGKTGANMGAIGGEIAAKYNRIMANIGDDPIKKENVRISDEMTLYKQGLKDNDPGLADAYNTSKDDAKIAELHSKVTEQQYGKGSFEYQVSQWEQSEAVTQMHLSDIEMRENMRRQRKDELINKLKEIRGGDYATANHGLI